MICICDFINVSVHVCTSKIHVHSKEDQVLDSYIAFVLFVRPLELLEYNIVKS